jgi:hypothetical protein
MTGITQQVRDYAAKLAEKESVGWVERSETHALRHTVSPVFVSSTGRL